MRNRYRQDTYEETNPEMEGIVCSIALNENIKLYDDSNIR